MSYHYSDPARASDPHAQPDFEVFHTYFGECGCDAPCGFADTMGAAIECAECGDGYRTADSGYFYAFGFAGRLWDSEPVGPFCTEAEAVEAARETILFDPSIARKRLGDLA